MKADFCTRPFFAAVFSIQSFQALFYAEMVVSRPSFLFLFFIALVSTIPASHGRRAGKGVACGTRCDISRRGTKKCVVSYCKPGKVCVREGQCNASRNSGLKQRCSRSGEVRRSCKTPDSSALHDPHMRGFDGTEFGFHGIHDHMYVVFGRKGGDLVVGRMSSTKKIVRDGVNATYFGEFGLTIGGSKDLVHLRFEQPSDTLHDEYFATRLNGKLVTSTVHSKTLKLSIDAVTKTVKISSADATYIINAVKTGYEGHHFNLKLLIEHKPSAKENYLGILGATLNRKTGRDVSLEFGNTLRAVELENHLRAMFEVNSIFPKHLNDAEVDNASFEAIRSIQKSKHSANAF